MRNLGSRNRDTLMWVQFNRVFKAILYFKTGMAILYDEDDNVLMRREGLSIEQLRKLESHIRKYGLKKNVQ